MPVRKYSCFNIPVYRNRTEEHSCRSPYHERYTQTSASDNPEGHVIKFTAFYQGEDIVHTILEKQLYRFHSLLTEVVRNLRCTILKDIFRDSHWFNV